MSARADKIIRPPETLLGREEPRKYPDFTWAQFYEFTQRHYRVNGSTLDGFVSWRRSSQPSSN